MLYGEEKLREMARSILPSTRRKSAKKDLQLCKRRHRRRMNMAVRAAMRDPDNELADDVDPLFYPDHEIRGLVRERQYGDKLNHFQKWAVEHTKDMGDDPGGRIAKMRSILPEGLIGWHACLHLDFMDEFNTNPMRYRWWGRRYKWEPKYERELMIRVLRKAVYDGDLVRILNNKLRVEHKQVRWVTGYGKNLERREQRVYWREAPVITYHLEEFTEEVGPEARQLKSIHDIEDFIDDVLKAVRVPRNIFFKNAPWVRKSVHATARSNGEVTHAIVEHRTRTRANPEHHPEWYKSLNDFLTCFLSHHGDLHEIRKDLGWWL